MTNYAEGVNPQLLRWARERAGYAVAEIAEAFKKDSSEIAGWEEGASVPTYVQLERLAYGFYKRPLALFFFPEPPEETDPSEEFRTLPEFEIANLLPDTRHAIREGQAMQEALKELCNGKNPASKLVFNDLQMQAGEAVPQAAERLRSYLEVTIRDQSAWPGPQAALPRWRERVEGLGVFVFKRALKQEDVSGFCLIQSDAAVWVLDPWALNKWSTKKSDLVLTSDSYSDRYLYPAYRQKRIPRRPIAIVPPYNSPRITVQRGAFTVHGSNPRGIDEQFKHALAKIHLGKDHCIQMRRELRYAGISEFTLFPDLDGLSRDIKAAEIEGC